MSAFFLLLKIVPDIFYQLYVTHAVHREHAIPVVVCLLRRKMGIMYLGMINKIVQFSSTWTPKSLLMDSERAAINVFSTIFPQATLAACYFHFCQSIHRQLQVYLLHLMLEDLRKRFDCKKIAFIQGLMFTQKI